MMKGALLVCAVHIHSSIISAQTQTDELCKSSQRRPLAFNQATEFQGHILLLPGDLGKVPLFILLMFYFLSNRLKILHLYGCCFMLDLESIKKINKTVQVFHDLPISAI